MTAPGHRAVTLTPPGRPLVGRIVPPGSKSITNRALLLAGLARGESRIEGALASDDTGHMAQALRRMGVGVTQEDGREGATFVVSATGRLEAPDGPLFLGNAGTAMRFLTAAAALVDGTVVLDGDAHMRKRPIGPLTRALAALGVEALRHRRAPAGHRARPWRLRHRHGDDRRRAVEPVRLRAADGGGLRRAAGDGGAGGHRDRRARLCRPDARGDARLRRRDRRERRGALDRGAHRLRGARLPGSSPTPRPRPISGPPSG